MTEFNFSWKHIGKRIGLTSCAVTTLSICASVGQDVQAATVVLDFEGLQNLEPINDFYNGGTGGFGSSSGKNFGVQFSPNSLGIIDRDAGGTGNIGGEPSPDTIAFFLTGDAAVMNVADGFDTGFSFFYSAINRPGVINVYEGLGGKGNLLTSVNLPKTPFEGAPDPTGQFSPFVPFGLSFEGIARSVDFGGTIDRIGFDNITLGSDTPGMEPTPAPEPLPPVPMTEVPTAESVPEPGSTAMLLAGIVGMGIAIARRHRLQQQPGFSANV